MKKLCVLLLVFGLALGRPQLAGNVDDDDDYDDYEEEAEEEETDSPEVVTQSGNFALKPGRPLRLPCQMNRRVGNDFSLLWSQTAPVKNPILATGGKNLVTGRKIRIEKIRGDKGEVMIVSDAKVGDVYQCQVYDKRVVYTVVDESDAAAGATTGHGHGQPNAAESTFKGALVFAFVSAFTALISL